MESGKNVYPRFHILRPLTIFAGVFGVIQSLGWIIISISGILTYQCTLDFRTETLTVGSLIPSAIHEQYFVSDACPSLNEHFKSITGKTLLSPSSVYICLWMYLVLNALWLLSSTALIKKIDKYHLRLTNIVLYLWILLALLISAFDFGLGIVFGLDYDYFTEFSEEPLHSAVAPSTTTPKPSDPSFLASQTTKPATTAIPPTKESVAVIFVAAKVVSISMMIIAMKGFILWILNVCCAIYFFIETFAVNDSATSKASLASTDVISDTHSIISRRPLSAYEASNPNVPEVHHPPRINTGALERANKMSLVGLKERFANRQNADPNRFKPYLSTYESNLPDPDYTPPMPRSKLFQRQISDTHGASRF